MRGLKKEVFKVVYLNSQNQIIDTADISEGTASSSSVPPREVVEGAVKNNATALIFVHNHPSGNLEPSDADKKITRQLSDAGKMLEIPVIDHLILTLDSFFSMADEGIL